jgi:sodium-dependent dicarboxylate transporter 2/3/5
MNLLRWPIVLLGVGQLLLVCFGPRWDEATLSLEAQRAIGVFIFCLIFWVTQAVPLAATSLSVFALVPLFGIASAEETFSFFGNRAVFFILGALLLAAALVESGLSKRVAVWVLAKFGASPASLMLGILFSAAFLSCWMPEHAVAALLFPVVLEIAISLHLVPGKSNFGKSLFFALAWGSIIGGITTLLGGARNPLALEIYSKYVIDSGLDIPTQVGFSEWVLTSWPITVLMLGVAVILLRNWFPPEIEDIRPAHDLLVEKVTEMGPLSTREWKTAAIYLVTLALWIFGGTTLGLAVVAILSGVSLFFLDVIQWKEAEHHVNWGVVLMYGGAVGLAEALTLSGASDWMVTRLLDGHLLEGMLLLAAVTAAGKLLTEALSNAAAVSLLLPIALALGQEAGVPLLVIVYAVALPCGLAFCLPMGTPPNAICFSSGYYSIKDAVATGVILNILSWVVVLLVAKFYWPLIGLYPG